MPVSLIEGDSLLALDVGSVKTRALYFDVVEGRYRFIAAGEAQTSAYAPVRHIGEGIRQAIDNLQSLTGITLIDSEDNLLMPATPEGMGVDAAVGTMSVGSSFKTVVAGLLGEISLDSAQQLAETSNCRIVEVIGMNDTRLPEEQIDSILKHQPDLIIIAGGTDGGASRSVQKLLEVLGLACYLLPKTKRPAIIFAGNQEMAEEVSSSLESLAASLHFAPNIRPSLEQQDISPAAKVLTSAYPATRNKQIVGTEDFNALLGGHLLPSAFAQARMVRFLSKVYGPGKGLLHVDVGISGVTISTAYDGELSSKVYPQFGLGETIANLLKYTSLEELAAWLPLEIPQEAIGDYLYQKSLYPNSIPVTKEELAIEQAVVRQVLRLAGTRARAHFPTGMLSPGAKLMPYIEPILAGGSALSSASTPPGQSLLMLLDGLQPTGVTTFILDQNNLLAALGAASSVNLLLPVQVFESGAFANLATVVSPVSSARYGSPVVKVRMVTDAGNESTLEAKAGGLEVLPLAPGQTGKLHLQPLRRADVGFGFGRSGTIRVMGSTLGVVIDARGRPLILPDDAVRRRDLIKKWLWTAGG